MLQLSCNSRICPWGVDIPFDLRDDAPMNPSLELRWTFAPEELFEESFVVMHSDCEISFQKGVVVATIELSALENDPMVRPRVESLVANVFLGAQIGSHVRFELSQPAVTSLSADGTRGTVIECELGRAEGRGYQADLRYTRAERVLRKRMLGELAALLAPTDQILTRMLTSYDAAARDPSDELVHLYEIRDSATARFGNNANAIASLRFSKKAWARLGQLCNDLPLKEGRHRGKVSSALRTATEGELTEARMLASTLIEAYMNFLLAAKKSV